MSDPLEKIQVIFLAPDVDEQTRRDNEEKISEWQRSLSRNQAYLTWKDSDITKEIVAEAKRIYRDAGIAPSINRTLTDKERFILWAEQDAAKLILTLVNEDATAALAAVHQEIATALNATN